MGGADSACRSLAAILVVVAYHMSEWRAFLTILHAPRSDVLVLLATFSLTVLVDLTVAIEVGMVLAAFLFMKRMAEVSNVTMVTGDLSDASTEQGDDAEALYRRQVPPGVDVYEINGPFFFGAVEAFRNALSQVAKSSDVLIIRMRHVPVVDATGINFLRTIIRQVQRDGACVILAEVNSQPLLALERAGVIDLVGAANMAVSLDGALAMAVERRAK